VAVLNPTTIFLHDCWQGQFYPLISRKALIAFRTTTPTPNGIAFIGYSGIENLGIVVMAKGAAQ
jgi:hypothetical protein